MDTAAAQRLLDLRDIRFRIAYRQPSIRPDDPELDGPHIHGSWEFYINISGQVSFLVDGELLPIRRADLVITCPGQLHHCICREACVHEHFCLWLDAPADSPLLRFLEPGQSHLRLTDEEDRSHLLNLLLRLQELEHTGEEPGRTAVFLQIFDLLSRRNTPAQREHSAMPEKLAEILEYMDSEFANISGLEEVLDRFYISSPTLYRWFRQYLRLSPRVFLESRKLSYAEQLLMQGRSVTEVALSAGFSDSSHFIRVFRKHFGKTPLQYKRTAR